jgi:4-hydroxy-2-oxoheptanedioate aldolase
MPRQRDGRPLLGTVLSLGDPALAELASAPLDFVWIDLEHGALDVRDAQALAIATQAAGATTYVRLPSVDTDRLSSVLDAGVDGIVAPQIEDAEQAARLVARLRYPPHGSRGFGPRRAGGYGRTSSFWTAEAAHVQCVVQIETPAGVVAADEIAAVEGVDGIVVGCADLALCLGVPGELGGAVQEAVEQVRAAASTHAVPFGLAAGGEAEAVAKLAGPTDWMLLYSADVRLYAAAMDSAVQRLVSAFRMQTPTWEESHVRH